MSSWVMTLNETSPELEQLLPPTDTRLRADIRALEQGVYDKASSNVDPSHLGGPTGAVRRISV